MAERESYIVLTDVIPISIGLVTDPLPECALNWEVRQRWVAEEPTEFWTEWETVERIRDEYPTMYPAYGEGNIFFRPIKKIIPVVHSTLVQERRLVRTWVDAEQGPMYEIVTVETRERHV